MTCQQRIQRAYQIFPGPAERGALGWEEHRAIPPDPIFSRRTPTFGGFARQARARDSVFD